MKLLRRLEDYGVDEIVQVGDLVDRGPDSIECVRIARTWTFTARGNRKKAPKQKKLKVVNGNHDNNYLYGRRHWQMPTRGFFPRFTEKTVGENLSKADHSVSEAEAHGGSRRYPPRVEGEAPD